MCRFHWNSRGLKHGGLMMDNNVFEKNILSHIEVAKKLSADKQALDSTLKAVEKIISSIRSGGKMLICGNGGSAADANHLAAEFINRYLKERAPIAAISLCANTSNITSIGCAYCNQHFGEIKKYNRGPKSRKGKMGLFDSFHGFW